MDREAYVRRIKNDEGLRDRVYLDSKGIPTCGYGHALHIWSPVPLDICERFLEEDLARVDREYPTLQLDLDGARIHVIKCMLFQMGLGGVKKFKRLLAAVRSQNWELAAKEMLESQWAKEDSPARALRLADIMRTGI